MNSKKHDSRCNGMTKRGKPCRAASTEGGLCYFHANPNKASELGRIGGRKNRHGANEHMDPLPDLNTALAVRETNKRLIEDLYAGKMDPRTASSLVRSLSLQLRAIETTDLARRLADVEKQLSQ